MRLEHKGIRVGVTLNATENKRLMAAQKLLRMIAMIPCGAMEEPAGLAASAIQGVLEVAQRDEAGAKDSLDGPLGLPFETDDT